MLFELRTYDLKPATATKYLEFFRSFGVGLVTQNLPMGGYWMAESGRLNRIYHLWIYDSFSHRDACRVELAKNTIWMRDFIPKAFEDVLIQSNRFMRLARSSVDFDAVVTDRASVIANANPVDPMFAPKLHAVTITQQQAAPQAATVAQFEIQSGDHVGQFLSLDRVAPDRDLITPIGATFHEIMRPLTVSPLK
jgi:hypothetical protein